MLGDGGAVETTALAQRCGWDPEHKTPFDVLPLIIETPDGELSAHSVPDDVVWEIALEHPTLTGFNALGLKWYGFPSIANKGMSIGGITYPTSPFTGWYLAPELSARDFSDTYRYNLLPEIAESFGIDTSDRRSLWQDRAVIELTTAVLHSYDSAGMRMDDHYTATEKFQKWVDAEARRGRTVDADWSWMIPPISASLTPVFHTEYQNEYKLPNFVQVPRTALVEDAEPEIETAARVPVHRRGRVRVAHSTTVQLRARRGAPVQWPRSMSSSRRVFMFAGAAFMVALSVANVVAGNASVIEMALYAAPFLAIVGLLLSGRYVAEERILAVYRSQPKPRRRKVAQRWPSIAELPFSAGIERAPWSLRGPPARVAA